VLSFKWERQRIKEPERENAGLRERRRTLRWTSCLAGGCTGPEVQAQLGSGIVDHSQKMTVAARTMAEKKVVGQRS
jgi:hypothetical protein